MLKKQLYRTRVTVRFSHKRKQGWNLNPCLRFLKLRILNLFKHDR